MLFTVFTPTYNRSHLLPRLYESLCQQTFKDFEWLIVDDGSTDDTELIIRGFQSEEKIIMRYFFQENGGKHRAINKGVKLATGELFFIADSDDIMLPHSLETVCKYYYDIKDNGQFVGICGLDQDFDGKIIGTGFPMNVIDCSSWDIRNVYNVRGDLKEIMKTEILKIFPFPEFEGEKFCPEDLVWNRIAQKYIYRHIDIPIYGVEYQYEGLTSNIIKIRMKSPQASVLYYKELFFLEKRWWGKIRSSINYWRFDFCVKTPYKKRMSFVAYIMWPIGLFLHLRDLIKTK